MAALLMQKCSEKCAHK